MVLFYFSGTGNTKLIAELFCRALSAEGHSIEERVDFAQMMASEDIIGFFYPVYGSRIPRIMREFAIRFSDQLKDKRLIIVCTQMAFSGDGARVFTDMFPPKHFQVIYAEHFVMPNNICNFFLLPLEKENKARKKLESTKRKQAAACTEISRGIIRKRGFNPFSQALGLIQGVFMPGIEKRALDRVWIDADCNRCRRCIPVCPMDNLKDENDVITAKGNCTLCCRCINKCPQKAISVLFHSKVKGSTRGWQAISMR